MKPLVECVPNFSEGRRQDVIAEIVEAMVRTGGIYLLDTTSDADHNRCVVTLAGLPEEVEKAIFAGIRTASQLINLDEHRGVHPRFGAADVIPLIPLRDVTMQECTALAHRLGQRVAYELQIPVYFYEEAALRPNYRDLAGIRRPSFQYEQLREVIGIDPAWIPDVGPAQLGPAGAVLIGARPFLIAYNAYLNTDNIEIAKKIARAIRNSSGGLRHVKSSGFLVNGRAQVSMNLTNFERTPIYRVMELLKIEAARYGVAVESTELVGLIPEMALLDSAQWYLQLEGFDPNRILERRLAQAEMEQTPLGAEEPPIPDDATAHVVLPSIDEYHRPAAFTESVAQSTVTPGGGAVSASAGALAAALAEMVSGLTIGKRGYEQVEGNMQAIKSTAVVLRSKLLDAIEDDIEAFNHLMSTIRLPKDDPDRQRAIQKATLHAAEVPLQVARLSYEAIQLLGQAAEFGNHNASIDAAVGAHLAMAAIEGSALNVRVNLMSLKDESLIQRYTTEINHIVRSARQLCPQIIAVVSQRTGLNEDI